MRILVTGFEPFGNDTQNASQEAVERLRTRWAAGTSADLPEVELDTATLAVSFARSGPALLAAVADLRPDVVLAVGEAGGRTELTPERWAVNADDARIPDNDGAQPIGARIDAGPDRRRLSLDPDQLAEAMAENGLPAAVSDDAGRFVCNHVAYVVAGSTGESAATGPTLGGFVHVPAVRSLGAATVGAETDGDARVAVSPLSFDDLARGLWCCVARAAQQFEMLRGSAIKQ